MSLAAVTYFPSLFHILKASYSKIKSLSHFPENQKVKQNSKREPHRRRNFFWCYFHGDEATGAHMHPKREIQRTIPRGAETPDQISRRRITVGDGGA